MQKILKSNWSKKNIESIQAHDATVQQNWYAFKSGRLNSELSPDLTDHLKKFTNRTLNLKPIDMPVADKTIVLPQGEFSEIISSYEALKSNTLIEDGTKTNKDSKPKPKNFEQDSTDVIDKHESSKYLVIKLK